MDNKRLRTFLVILTLVLCLNLPPFIKVLSAQETGTIERTRQLQEKEQLLRQKIEKKDMPGQIEEPAVTPTTPSKSQEKILIKDIRVKGVSLVSEEEINKIISSYKNKEVVLAEMQKVADLITDLYRKKGYITSRAYLPPQKIQEGILDIIVVEGKTGAIEVKGNRYYKAAFLKKKITLKEGEPFNFNTLRKNLVTINQNPDRFCSTVLTPGKEPGTTDIVLNVKDRLPIHIGFDWDNFGSRYIERDRYSVRFIDNNLFGIDDNLTFQYELSQASRYFLKNIRYLVPLNPDLKVGASAVFSRVKLGKEYEDSDVSGKTQIYGIFATQSLARTDNLELTFNAGFDYKNITNYQLQRVSSEDRLRVAKAGLDLDMTDNLGRTVFSHEADFGIPNIMGGMNEKEFTASRDGAGGTFIKNGFNLLRLQKMPFSSSLLLKSQVQVSPYILTSSEQFQIGGIANVRGYPPAEAVGDSGYATTFEWLFPPYPVPKNIKVPFSKAKLYDAVKFAIFYDWANAHLIRPSAAEEKNKTLRGAGFGVRFNLPEDLSMRVDLAWPLDNTPSDTDHLHCWAQVSKTF